RLQRDVDRTREVLVVESVRRQNLDELGIFCAAKPLKFVTIDWCGHIASLIGSYDPTLLHPPRLPVDERDRPGGEEQRNDEIADLAEVEHPEPDRDPQKLDHPDHERDRNREPTQSDLTS